VQQSAVAAQRLPIVWHAQWPVPLQSIQPQQSLLLAHVAPASAQHSVIIVVSVRHERPAQHVVAVMHGL
jgi:hypothetical protein